MAGKQIAQWPSYFFGPGGQSSVFNRAEDVPAGWCKEPEDVVEASEPPPPDGDDAWAGHRVIDLIAALRAAGQPIRAFENARQIFERALAVGAIPGYGKP